MSFPSWQIVPATRSSLQNSAAPASQILDQDSIPQMEKIWMQVDATLTPDTRTVDVVLLADHPSIVLMLGKFQGLALITTILNSEAKYEICLMILYYKCIKTKLVNHISEAQSLFKSKATNSCLLMCPSPFSSTSSNICLISSLV